MLRSRRALAAHGTVFLVTRGTNAALALAQIALVSHFYSTSAAATFFVFWTVVWAGSVLLRFGTDQIIPKHVALASRDGDLGHLSGFRAILRWTLPAVALASAPILIVTLPSATAAEALAAAPALLLAALAWAAAYVVMGVAKGYGEVSLAGVVQGVVVPIGFTVVAPLAAAIDHSWLTLAYVTSLGTLAASVASLALVARAVGRSPLRAAFSTAERPVREPDRIPTGMLGGIIEIVLWLPLWLASAIGVSDAEIAGLYAALRVSGTFSWAFTAVVSVTVPLMARALADRDYHALARLLWRAAGAGLLITVPIAALGIVFAPEILRLLDPAYAAYASTLVILIVARLFDAATGPLSECLVLGGRARWELGNQVVGLVVIVAAGLALEPSLGVEAFAWGTAIALTVENVVRVEQLRRLFRTHWRPSRRGHRARLGPRASGPVTVGASVIAPPRGTLLGGGLGTVVAAGVAQRPAGGRRRQQRRARRVRPRAGGDRLRARRDGPRRDALRGRPRHPMALWPLGLAIPLWLATFGLRALTLWGSPEFADRPAPGARIRPRRPHAIGRDRRAGIAAWCLGYLSLLLPERRGTPPDSAGRAHLSPALGRWRSWRRWSAAPPLGRALPATGGLRRADRRAGDDPGQPAVELLRLRRRLDGPGRGDLRLDRRRSPARVAPPGRGAAGRGGVRRRGPRRRRRRGVCLQLRELTLALIVAMLVSFSTSAAPERALAGLAAALVLAVVRLLLVYQQVREYSQRVDDEPRHRARSRYAAVRARERRPQHVRQPRRHARARPRLGRLPGWTHAG